MATNYLHNPTNEEVLESLNRLYEFVSKKQIVKKEKAPDPEPVKTPITCAEPKNQVREITPSIQPPVSVDFEPRISKKKKKRYFSISIFGSLFKKSNGLEINDQIKSSISDSLNPVLEKWADQKLSSAVETILHREIQKSLNSDVLSPIIQRWIDENLTSLIEKQLEREIKNLLNPKTLNPILEKWIDNNLSSSIEAVLEKEIKKLVSQIKI